MLNFAYRPTQDNHILTNIYNSVFIFNQIHVSVTNEKREYICTNEIFETVI